MNIRSLKNIMPLLMLAATTFANGQEYRNIPSLRESGIPDLKIVTERQFISESLFGYMNGGAELYLEYGFDTLIVTEMEWGDESFKVEIFNMKGEEEAFGIYSVSIFRCVDRGVVTPHSCLSQYQFQLCQSDSYINIINNNGSQAGAEKATELGRYLSGKINSHSFDPETFFQEGLLDDYEKLVLVKGSLGLYNGASEWEELLGVLKECTTIIASAGNNTCIMIRANSPKGEASLKEFTESAALPPEASLKMTGPGNCKITVPL